MLELYNAAVSTCSQKVRLVMAEKGLEYVDRQLSFAANDHLSDWYLRLNPNGVVPTLVHDDKVVTDSSVINEYLDETFPSHPLVPADPYERARMRVWRQYIDEVPTTAIRPPSFNAFVVGIWARLSDEEWEAHKARMPLRKHLYQRMSRNGFPKADIDEALERLEQTLERMDQSLREGPWLNGERFSLADISLVPTIVRMQDIGLDHMWAERPRVGDWYERVQSRPSFAAAYASGSRQLGPNC